VALSVFVIERLGAGTFALARSPVTVVPPPTAVKRVEVSDGRVMR
jgi:hypothetical protein